ncbi:MAG: DUF4390 domain-containing protein, partial [Thermoanaerobaculia bacterium]
MSSRFLVLAFVLSAGLPPRVAHAQSPPSVPGVSTFFTGRELRVTAHLEPGLPPEIRARLSSGLATTTVWSIGLFVFRNLWFDGKKDERLYQVTATYRPASGDYILERRMDGRLLESQVLPTKDEAERALSKVSALPCFLMGGHLTGKKLVVKV